MEEVAHAPPAVALVLNGDLAAAIAVASEQDDPEDRYLDLILVATACTRRGETAAARAAAARAVDVYRPIVEEGLYFLYGRYLTEVAQTLPPREIGAFVQAMEPEVAALGALPAAADPPLPFLALYNTLFAAASGARAALDNAGRHAASHLLLGDIARRWPDEPGVDHALLDLATLAASEAAALARKAVGGADPFGRDRLRRSLLRQVAAVKALFERTSPDAMASLWGDGASYLGIPFDALADLPRGLRLEALQAMAAALAPLPAAQRAALYPRFLMAAHPPGVESGSMLRRQAGAVARITAPFIDAEPTAAGDLESLVDWFLGNEAYLGEGAAEEAARNFAQALVLLGTRAAASLEGLLPWAEEHAPAGAPALLAAWATAGDCLPTALRPDCFATPFRTWRIVREAPREIRPRWAASAIANPDWDLRELIRSEEHEQRAIADLLTYHPDPLAEPDLALDARSVILGEHGGGPFARTLALLGPDPAPYPLAVLLDARVGSRGYEAPEHDEALRHIVWWACAQDANAALRLAAGFGTRNHVSWLLGTLLAEGSAARLDPDVVRLAAPHPFLLGAYLLERAERAR